MLPQLTTIKTTRKKYAISQKELAQQAGVSQSLIAKIEAGTIQPTYEKVQKIFQCLDELRNTHEPTAHDCMNTNITFANPEKKILEIITTMQQQGISQIPVRENESVVGMLTESILMNTLIDRKEQIHTATVQEVMGDVPPIIPQKTTQRTVLELLKENQVVLVARGADIVGIISKSDILKNV